MERDAEYFLELQTQTGWGRTLSSFAEWCAPQPGWMTLDVGCGPGLLPALFSRLGCQAVGVDLDPAMFRPRPLHSLAAAADVFHLPFKSKPFDLVSATNLLFLLAEPEKALVEMKRVLAPRGKVCLLNPSEKLNEADAKAFAQERKLEGMARDTFVNWARRAEQNQRWTEDETQILLAQAGLQFKNSILRIGPGFAFFCSATV